MKNSFSSWTFYRLLNLIVFFGYMNSAYATTYYVRPGASGNGSSWADAYGDLPAALERGSTYYLAAGQYPNREFNDPEVGESIITLKKATRSDHGTDDGWSDAYAGQAVVEADWNFYKGYYVIDGQVRNEADWQDAGAYGIRIMIGPGSEGHDVVGAILIPEQVTGVSIRRVAMTGADCAYGKVAGRGIDIGSGAVNITLRQCLIANASTPILTRGVNGMRVESCWIGPNYPIYDGYHCEAWSDCDSQNVTICNNRFVDIMNTAFITVLTSIGPREHRNWKIYGNVFMHSPTSGWNGWGVGNGIIAVINDNWATGWRVYNNTIVNTRGWFASIELPGTDNAVFNNIWYHLGRNPQGDTTGIGITATEKGSNWIFLDNGSAIHPSALAMDNVYGSGDPFIDWRTGDLRLNPDAFGLLPIDTGRMLDGEYDNVDPAGTIRGGDGGCDIGAFEKPGILDQTPPAAPSDLRKISATQSRVEVAWSPPEESPVIVRTYKVLRDGDESGSTSKLVYADTYLQPLTTYRFDVCSESYAGILSDPAGEILVTTLEPDVTPPSAPPDIQGSALSSCDVTVSWSPSSDNQRVAGYNVSRDGARILTTEETSFSQTDLEPSTFYTYRVTAFDDADNQSEPAQVVVRTQDLPTTMQSGLVARYSFNEGAGYVARDSSALNNNGTIIFGAGGKWQPGKSGLSLEFNGGGENELDDGDYVEVLANPTLELTTGMTLMAWVYPSSTPMGWQNIVSKEYDGLSLGYFLTANAGYSDTPLSGVKIENNWVSAGGNSRLPARTWSHLASTFDGRNLKIYVNADQVSNLEVNRPIQPTGGALHIGGDDLGEFFGGRIDELMIFNRALAPAEVLAIYKEMEGSTNSARNWTLYR